MDFFMGILEQGFIFGIAALGVYITYSILDFPDLSVDGTFTLGAAITASLIMKGSNPLIALAMALLLGLLAGMVTGILHVKFKITNLLSGILVMIGLYSINLRIMGKANIPLFNKASIFAKNINSLLIVFIFLVIIKLFMDWFFKTKLGFILKVTGDNEALVTSLGVDKGYVKILGLMLSNGLVALAGGIMAQYQKFADISMGNGIIVMALAAIILGQSIFKKDKLLKATTIVILGSVLYKLITGIALKLGLAPTDLKLITAVIVVIAITLNNNSFSRSFKKLVIRRGGQNA